MTEEQRIKHNERQKKSYQRNKDKRKKAFAEYYIKNKEKLIEYKVKNAERVSQVDKEYNQRPEVIEKRKSRIRKRRLEDNMFRIREGVRHNVALSFSRALNEKVSKSKNTESILGCTIEEFISYIETKFTEGMSLDNYGHKGWHLDHIIPISSATSEKEIYELCKYSNYQPLWWKDNLIKSNK